jgi:hypothetical protein
MKTKTQNGWKAIRMYSHWFDLTRVLLVNESKMMELRLGCIMCGYKFNSSVPCVVSVGKVDESHIKTFYNEKILPRAANILEAFSENFDLDELYDQVSLNGDVELNWTFDDDC